MNETKANAKETVKTVGESLNIDEPIFVKQVIDVPDFTEQVLIPIEVRKSQKGKEIFNVEGLKFDNVAINGTVKPIFLTGSLKAAHQVSGIKQPLMDKDGKLFSHYKWNNKKGALSLCLPK